MKTAALLLALTVACSRGPEIDDLARAVRGGDVARASVLLAHGADPNRPSGACDWTPLMHAVHKNQPAAAEVLLKRRADVNRGAPDGTTPLMMAAGCGNDAMVVLLLRCGADPHLRNDGGDSALDFALRGVTDIDGFTLFRCQSSTAAMLARRHVTARITSHVWARLKRCPS